MLEEKLKNVTDQIISKKLLEMNYKLNMIKAQPKLVDVSNNKKCLNDGQELIGRQYMIKHLHWQILILQEEIKKKENYN